jgi:hypothetical protein
MRFSFFGSACLSCDACVFANTEPQLMLDSGMGNARIGGRLTSPKASGSVVTVGLLHAVLAVGGCCEEAKQDERWQKTNSA